ncbi:iron chelate uptake ABC transporter family permease subunit [Streptomyces arenae]|uniref:iron chelate uptake ABC transporter family permease subunit n=1 Tax=Streptomyces arenae TaxID=29301 RepID=UPI00265B257C|nr:iron chelate uptake ABC transporter family permease subunit [Streptomyces arenae]MCG7208718.1 iron ABC transporter permease [Streptomyces arenae]
MLRPHPRFSLLLHRRSPAVVLGLLVLLAAVMAASASLGQTYVPPPDVWRTIRGDQTPYALVVGELRVPRIVLGALVGTALGLAGALVQTVTRNPLASPDVIGVGHGAAAATVAGDPGGCADLPGRRSLSAVPAGPRTGALTQIVAVSITKR